MAWEYDKFKAQIFFTHLLKASRKFEERHVAKEDLAVSLKRLSKFKVNKEFSKEIKQLKQKINTLVDKQSVIIRNHKDRSDVNKSLKEKISVLEQKLGVYIEDKKRKNKRIAELELKMKARQGQSQALSSIKGELEGLETLYANVKDSEHVTPKQLQKLEGKIGELKMRLQTLQSK